MIDRSRQESPHWEELSCFLESRFGLAQAILILEDLQGSGEGGREEKATHSRPFFSVLRKLKFLKVAI